MNEQPKETNTPSKMQFGEFIKKHCNYPMLLLAVVSIAGIRGIVSSFIGIFSTLFSNPLQVFSAIISFVLSVAPIILLMLLWLDRFEKIKNAKIIMGIFLVLLTIGTIYYEFSIISLFFSNISQYDAYTLFAKSPFLSVLNTVLKTLVYIILAAVILCNKKTPIVYYVFVILSIITTLFFGILSQMAGFGSLIEAFLTTLSYIALYQVPKTLVDSHSTDINPAKKKGLIAIAAVTLFVFIVASIAVGGGTSNDVSKNTCGSCGRSYKAGDAGGNFMSIAKTGLCKNCNSNREYFEWIFD